MMGLLTTLEATHIHSIIQTFYEASGMDINKVKCQIFFFSTPLMVQLHNILLLGFTRNSLPSKYLDITLIDKAMRNDSWEDIMFDLRKKLSSWAFRSLNLPSQLILLKSILQSLPIYSFFALVAPSFILMTIRNLQRNFFW